MQKMLKISTTYVLAGKGNVTEKSFDVSEKFIFIINQNLVFQVQLLGII